MFLEVKVSLNGKVKRFNPHVWEPYPVNTHTMHQKLKESVRFEYWQFFCLTCQNHVKILQKQLQTTVRAWSLSFWNCLCGDVTLADSAIHLLPTFFAEPGTFWKHLATMISNLPTDLSFLAAYVIVPQAVSNRNTRKQHLGLQYFPEASRKQISPQSKQHF